MDFNYCLGLCSPKQIISLKYAINDVSKVAVYDNCGNLYDDSRADYAYSLDGTCWSCFETRDKVFTLTDDLKTDFYVRVRVAGVIGSVQVCNLDVEYSVNLESGFNLQSICDLSSMVYSPYSNMDAAIALQQQMSDYVACVVGIPIFYFKVTPTASSKDITFKEYCLMNVSEVKQLKLVVKDGQMPSSKPMFSDFGIDFQTDWDTEISKSQFATAFGITAKPMEGDLIYIPMMQRMWMVNSAYEEKKDGFLWNATTFTVSLVKYQEKGSVDLGNLEEFVASLVTQKYLDLFSEDEEYENIEAGVEQTEAPLYAANNLYNVFESDSVRKQVSVLNLDIVVENINLTSTKVADSMYKFNKFPSTITYQKTFCGDEGTCTFIMRPNLTEQADFNVINIGNIKINLVCEDNKLLLKLFNIPSIFLELQNGEQYFVMLRWSRKMNIVEMSAAQYTFNKRIPLYKLLPFHYYFNIDKADKITSKFDIEMVQDTKREVFINNFEGKFTNFKLFNAYIDNRADMIQQYPTHSSLIINDTARKLIDMDGTTTIM